MFIFLRYSVQLGSNNFVVIISSCIEFLLEFINSSCVIFCLVSGNHIQ